MAAGIISLGCLKKLKVVSVTDDEVINVARGIAILVPDLVGVEGDKIVVNASHGGVAAAIDHQLEQLHSPPI